MVREGYSVLTVKDEVLAKLEWWKKKDESWSDFLGRLADTFDNMIVVIEAEIVPKYSTFAKYKDLVQYWRDLKGVK